MELIVQRGADELPVSVRREGDLYRVTVGDRSYRVDVAAAGDGLASLLIDGGQYEVSVRASAGRRGGDRRRWEVSGRHGDAAVEVTDPLTHLAGKVQAAAGSRGPERVAAYMPGRVVAVLVEEGAEVEAGAGVVVLEAMKMENEIRAERAGRVRKLFIEPGQAVEGGDPLFELE